MKFKPLALACMLASLAACGQINSTNVIENDIQGDLDGLLSAVPSAKPVARRQHSVEEVRIPRNAPWLGMRIDAQYQDEAKSAIKTVLQGRPVVFNLKSDTNPFVSSPVDASTVMGHLDAIMVQSDWAYAVDGGVLVVSDTVSRQFTLQAIPGIGVGRVALGAAGATGSAASNSLDLISAPYRDLENSLRSIASDYETVVQAEAIGSAEAGSPQASMITMSPSSNAVIVNGPPSLMRRVERIVEEFNEAVNRKVHIIITVYDVQFTSSSQRSIDFDLLRKAAIGTTASFQGSSLISATPGSLSLGLDFFEGNSMDASSLVFNLLRQQGQTSVRIHEAFEATNNQVFSIQDQRTTPYISQVSTERSDGGSISSLTPSIETEEVNTGLGFHVVASIANDSINIRLGLTQSDLIRFDPYKFGSGDSGISGSLPVTDNQSRIIPMNLRDGETRLIANLSQSQSRNDTGDSGFGFLGRAKSKDTHEKQTVIAVSVKIL